MPVCAGLQIDSMIFRVRNDLLDASHGFFVGRPDWVFSLCDLEVRVLPVPVAVASGLTFPGAAPVQGQRRLGVHWKPRVNVHSPERCASGVATTWHRGH